MKKRNRGEKYHRSVRAGYPLTAREREVMHYVCKGFSNPQIGMALGIGACTVGDHLRSIYVKLHAGTRVEAAVMMVREEMAHEA